MKYIRLLRTLLYKSTGMILVFMLAGSISLYAQNDEAALAEVYEEQVFNDINKGEKNTSSSKLATMVRLKEGPQNFIAALESIARQAGLQLSYSKQFIL